MKKVSLLFLSMLISVAVFSQDELKFSKVIQSESGADKEQLYAVMRSFIATYYHNSKEVIQMDDKDAGIIICKATSPFNAPGMMYAAYDGWLDYNLKIQVRDGRVRVEVFHFFHHNKPGNQAKAQLGVLTTAEEYANSGMQKKYHNKVWNLLKDQKENTIQDTQEEEW